MSTAADAMPEKDWLTGLSSRAAFARHCNQIERDGDRFVLALFEIGDMTEINQQLDHDTGDDLLRAVGRALATHTSVETMAARLDGAQLALMTTGEGAEDPRRWVAPAVGAVKSAAADWTFELIEQFGRCPAEPDLRIGVATGVPSRARVDAETALTVAKTDAHATGSMVVHDPDDPRIQALDKRRYVIDRLDAGLDDRAVTAVGRRIEAVRGTGDDWRWYRLSASLPDRPFYRGVDDQPSLQLLDDGGYATVLFDPHQKLPAPVEMRLEDWLVEQAGQILSDGGGQLRLTVPVGRRIKRGGGFAQRLFAAVERFRLPPSRILFEVTEADLVASAEAGQEFVRRLHRIGSGVVVTGCGGGWRSMQVLNDLPFAHICPDRSLVAQALTDNQAALSILALMVADLTDEDKSLIAPVASDDTRRLVELGFSFFEDGAATPIGASLPKPI